MVVNSWASILNKINDLQSKVVLVIISRKSKISWQYNGQKKKDKGQTMMYKTLHRKLSIQQREPHYNRGWTQMPLIYIDVRFSHNK
jgi:hypothetical protein